MTASHDNDALSGGLSYPYAWPAGRRNPTSTIFEFTCKYRPSMVQNDGTKPWIWAYKDHKSFEGYSADMGQAVEEASILVGEVTDKVQKIQGDPLIPVLPNKKGTKSKKELCEAEQAQATEKLKEISRRTKYVLGKWLVFSPPERVDAIWASIANSLVAGHLSKTAAYAAKVSTTPQRRTQNYEHVVCVYIPDVYEKDAVTEVFRVLLRHHGLSASGVKSDLYTHIGLDSKHPSGIPSMVWKNRAVLADAEIKRLREEYLEELRTARTQEADSDAMDVD